MQHYKSKINSSMISFPLDNTFKHVTKGGEGMIGAPCAESFQHVNIESLDPTIKAFLKFAGVNEKELRGWDANNIEVWAKAHGIYTLMDQFSKGKFTKKKYDMIINPNPQPHQSASPTSQDGALPPPTPPLPPPTASRRRICIKTKKPKIRRPIKTPPCQCGALSSPAPPQPLPPPTAGRRRICAERKESKMQRPIKTPTIQCGALPPPPPPLPPPTAGRRRTCTEPKEPKIQRRIKPPPPPPPPSSDGEILYPQTKKAPQKRSKPTLLSPLEGGVSLKPTQTTKSTRCEKFPGDKPKELEDIMSAALERFQIRMGIPSPDDEKSEYENLEEHIYLTWLDIPIQQ